MTLRHASWLGWCVLVACSSQSSGDGKTVRSLNDGDDGGVTNDAGAESDAGAEIDASTEVDAGSPDGGDVDAGPPGRLTPSNLPPDICDTPGTRDLVLPGDGGTGFGACDAVVSQGSGLPEICVFKFATVSIADEVRLLSFFSNRGKNDAVAIVATNTFTLSSTGKLDASGQFYYDRSGAGGPDPRGEAHAGGGGAGHVTRGAGAGTGGDAYASTGNQLVAGAVGGVGAKNPGSSWPFPTVHGGYAGGAIQLVSCGRLELHGTILANGNYGVSMSKGSGSGGGSGGTVLLEAAQIVASGARLEARGGNGGSGTGNDCSGGKGGTGSTPPEDGTYGNCWYASSGSGGSIGRILINLPAGTPPPSVNADPPAKFGVVATH